jgi:hypothetical protein
MKISFLLTSSISITGFVMMSLVIGQRYSCGIDEIAEAILCYIVVSVSFVAEKMTVKHDGVKIFYNRM